MCRQIFTRHLLCDHTSIEEEQCLQASSPFSTFFCDEYSVAKHSCSTSLCGGRHCKEDPLQEWRTKAAQLVPQIIDLKNHCAQTEHECRAAIERVVSSGPLQKQREKQNLVELRASLIQKREDLDKLVSRVRASWEKTDAWTLHPGPSTILSNLGILPAQTGVTSTTMTASMPVSQEMPMSALEKPPEALGSTESFSSGASQYRQRNESQTKFHPNFKSSFNAASTGLQSSAATASRPHPPRPVPGRPRANHQGSPRRQAQQQGDQNFSSTVRGRGRRGRGARKQTIPDRTSSPIRRSGRLVTKRKVKYAESSEDEQAHLSPLPKIHSLGTIGGVRIMRDTSIEGRGKPSKKPRRTSEDDDSDFSDHNYIEASDSERDDDGEVTIGAELEDVDHSLALPDPSYSIIREPRVSGHRLTDLRTEHNTSQPQTSGGTPKETIHSLVGDPKVQAFMEAIERSGGQLPEIERPSGTTNRHIHPPLVAITYENATSLTNSQIPGTGLQPPVPEPHAFARAGFFPASKKAKRGQRQPHPNVLSSQSVVQLRQLDRPTGAINTIGAQCSPMQHAYTGLEWASPLPTTYSPQLHNSITQNTMAFMCAPQARMTTSQSNVQHLSEMYLPHTPGPFRPAEGFSEDAFQGHFAEEELRGLEFDYE